jgi:predicted nuclease of restriction endonuclease-like (RecB) superfamily
MSNIEKYNSIGEALKQIRQIVEQSRQQIAQSVNEALLQTYWEIGRVIVEQEQHGNAKAEYGKVLIRSLSKALTKELGRGFSVSNLFNMRNFYLTYQKFQTVSGKLSWSHYCELLSISDADKRSFYGQECIRSNWSVRELKRQIKTSLFERLLLSDGQTNKEKVLQLAREGQTFHTPADVLKDPYVFEFLALPEKKPVMEKDLHRKLLRHLEDFLLELGRGFMFVGSEQRITIDNTHFSVDLVFYHKILRCYILIDLKTTRLDHTHVGQMNMYLNYYLHEINDDIDNPPVGIILCTDKNEIMAEYALGGISNQIFASRYVPYIPDKELLIRQVERILQEENTDQFEGWRKEDEIRESQKRCGL